MAVFNHAKREINAKIVFFGPVGCGKASLLRFIHQRIKPSLCGPLKSMPAGGATLQFFEYVPFERSSLDGYQVRFHLYTLTGPVENLATWKMILKGVDGLALVTVAGAEQSEDTVLSLQQLRSVLAAYGMTLSGMPTVLLSNKSDLLATDAADADWGDDGLAGKAAVATSAVNGTGVLQALAALSQDVLQQLRERQTSEVAEQSADISDLQELEPVTKPEQRVEEQQQSTDQLSIPVPVLVPGEVTTLRLPVAVQVAGEARQLTLVMSVTIEE